jgi:hypothetical protein
MQGGSGQRAELLNPSGNRFDAMAGRRVWLQDAFLLGIDGKLMGFRHYFTPWLDD